MTNPLLPVSAVSAVAVPVPAMGTAAVAARAGAAATATTPAVVPVPTASGQVQWSAQTLQSFKLQAFEQLIAQLALQIQGSPDATLPRWPTQGLPAPTLQLVQQLLAQIQITVQGQAQPLQLLAAQPGSVALMQALVQALVQAASPQGAQAANQPQGQVPAGSAMQTAAALSSTAAAALEQSSQGAALPRSHVQPPLLQNWWVQQGSLTTPQGERHFSLTLQVPAAWAQAAGAAQTVQASSVPLRLPVADMAALPASGPLALVIQAQGVATSAASSTSALLWLELQPANPSTSTAAAAMPIALSTPALAQEVQQLLQNKADPWLMMAAAQAANALPVPRKHGEHRSHLCSTEGCQYQGLAPCAQPFCSEMNRIWATTRIERSS
ncbi:MAG: Fe-S oxidoreductase [Comamonas sp.]